MTELCQRIYDECQRKDVSLTKVMGDAGLSISMFYKWKDGTSSPRGRSVKAIARVLGIPASTLSPDLTDDAEVVAASSPLHDADGEGLSEEFQLVAIRRSTINTLRPLLEKLNAGVFELPDDVSKGLLDAFRAANLLYHSRQVVALTNLLPFS